MFRTLARWQCGGVCHHRPHPGTHPNIGSWLAQRIVGWAHYACKICVDYWSLCNCFFDNVLWKTTHFQKMTKTVHPRIVKHRAAYSEKFSAYSTFTHFWWGEYEFFARDNMTRHATASYKLFYYIGYTVYNTQSNNNSYIYVC